MLQGTGDCVQYSFRQQSIDEVTLVCEATDTCFVENSDSENEGELAQLDLDDNGVCSLGYLVLLCKLTQPSSFCATPTQM